MTATVPRSVWVVLVAALALRWIGLGRQSLWFDEGVTWAWATLPTWRETLLAEPNHPPVWWLITRAWIGVFGDAEASLRMPAAICGVLAVFFGWLLGLRVLSPMHAPRRGGFRRENDGGMGARYAVWFAAALAGANYFIEYGQDARMYALLLAESIGLALLYLRWLDRDDRLSLVAYANLAAFTLHTHYFAIWPIAALAVHAMFLALRTRGSSGGQRVRLLPFALANVAGGLLFVPWLVYLITHYQRLSLPLPDVPFQRLAYIVWRMGAGPAVFVDAARLREGEYGALRDEAPTLLAVAAAWLLPVLVGTWSLRCRPGTASLALFSVAIPVLGLLTLYNWMPLLQERYLVFVAPWVWLLAVLGAMNGRSWWRLTLRFGLCALVTTTLATYHLASRELEPHDRGAVIDGFQLPTEVGAVSDRPTGLLHRGRAFGKEPWREVGTFVNRHAREGDLVVLGPGSLHFVWDYYGRQRAPGPLPVLRLPDLPPPPEALLAQFGELLANYDRVFLVVSHAVDGDPDHAYRSLHGALAGLWRTVDVVPPIAFRRRWTIHVSIFARSR